MSIDFKLYRAYMEEAACIYGCGHDLYANKVHVWRRLEYIAPIVRRAIEMEEFIQFNIA